LRFFGFGLRFEALGFGYWCGSFRYRARTIFGQRFAGQHKRFLGGCVGWSGSARSLRRTPVEVTARAAVVVAAAICIATTAAAAIVSTVTTFWAAIFTLWGSVLRRRQIAPAALPESTTAATSTTMPTATTAKTSAATASAKLLPVAATISTAVAASTVTTSIAASITTGAVTRGRAVLSGVVAWSKILRSRLIRIRLALFFPMNLFHTGGAGFGFFDVRMNVVSGDRFAVTTLLGVGLSDFGYVLRRRCFIFGYGHRRVLRMTHGFAGERLDVRDASGGDCHRRGFVSVAVIVVLEIFENVTDVQERVSVQTDVHECRLHAG